MLCSANGQQETPNELLLHGGAVMKVKAIPDPGSVYVRDVDLASRWRVARASVWRWAKKDKDFPPPVRFGEGTTRWRLSDIEKWEAERAGSRVGA